MKKIEIIIKITIIIILIGLIVILYSCELPKNRSNKPNVNVEVIEGDDPSQDYKIIKIDGCTFIQHVTYNSSSLVHHPKCKNH